MKLSFQIFLSSMLLLALLLNGCATAGRKAKTQTTDLKVIDAHTHTLFVNQPEPNSHIMMSEDEYFRELKEVGGVGAIAHTIPPGALPLGDLNSFKDLRSKNVFHCAGVSAHINSKDLDSKLRSGLYRCIKVYLGYIHQYAYDRNYDPVYKLAEKYDVPVVFHTGDTYYDQAMLKYSDPLTIDEVAVRHPKVRLVIAHCGNPWIESAAEVAYKNSNVYLDGSALLISGFENEAKVDEFLVKPLKWIFGYIEDPKKLMFGTDWPLSPMKPYFEAFKRAIPKEHWQAVFHDNAVRVFKLKDVLR